MSTRVRIAIPTAGEGGLDAGRSAHFGRADSFTIVDVEDGAIVASETLANPPHEHGGCGAIVARLAESGVRVAIVVGMGGGPRAAMAASGIEALHDPESPTPRAAAEAYVAGTLESFGGTHVCGGH